MHWCQTDWCPSKTKKNNTLCIFWMSFRVLRSFFIFLTLVAELFYNQGKQKNKPQNLKTLAKKHVVCNRTKCFWSHCITNPGILLESRPKQVRGKGNLISLCARKKGFFCVFLQIDGMFFSTYTCNKHQILRHRTQQQFLLGAKNDIN